MTSDRLDVHSSAIRCPYCHETCGEADDVAVCRRCFAPHHTACWRELSCCGACQGTVALTQSLEVRAAPVSRKAESSIGLAHAVGYMFGWTLFWLRSPARGWRRACRQQWEAVRREPWIRRRVVGMVQVLLLIATLTAYVGALVAVGRDADSAEALAFAALIPGLPFTLCAFGLAQWFASGAQVRLFGPPARPARSEPRVVINGVHEPLDEDRPTTGQVRA